MTGTFSMIPHWLLDAGASANAVLTYAHLARYGTFNPAIGEYESIYPSKAALCARLDVSEPTLRRGLVELEKLGAVQRVARAGHTNVYRVVFGSLVPPSPVTPPRMPGEDAPVTGDAPPPSPVTPNLEPIPKTKDQEQDQTLLSTSPTEEVSRGGTRLPEKFSVTESMRTWFTAQPWARLGTREFWVSQHEQFCDYWRSKPGAAGRKTDWPATWRNWMRKAAERLPGWVGTATQSKRALTNQAWAAQIARSEASEAAQIAPPAPAPARPAPRRLTPGETYA